MAVTSGILLIRQASYMALVCGLCMLLVCTQVAAHRTVLFDIVLSASQQNLPVSDQV